MKIDFSIQQKQSKFGSFVLFAYSMQKTVRISYALVFVFFLKIKTFDYRFVLAIAALVLFNAVVAYLKFRRFTFYIDYKTNEFVIEEGIFNKTKITIELSKVQQVSINQTLIHKITNLYAVEFDTAGSEKKEATIKALDLKVVNALKQELIQNKQEESTSNVESFATSESNKQILKIPFLTLVKVGLTSKYLETFALILVFFNTIYENLGNFIEENFSSYFPDDTTIDNYTSSFYLAQTVIISLLFIVFAVLIVNLTRTLIKFFDFTVEKQNSSLLLKYGLFTTKNTLLNPNKVQLLKLSQNYIQKKLNITNLKIQQATSSDNPKAVKDSGVEVPGCSNAEKEQILALIFNSKIEPTFTLKPHIRKWLIGVFFGVLFPIAIVLFFQLLADFFMPVPLYLGLSVYFVLGVLLQWLLFKNYQLSVSSQYVIKSNGAWDKDQVIVETHKIQALKTSQFFWQKRHNIGSVSLYTAGGNFSFTTANFKTINQLVNQWLYQVETSTKNWM